jgi:hypothetical protein
MTKTQGDDARMKMEIALIRDEDLGRHEPPEGADESWQESWGMFWCDQERRAGGINHISIQRQRGIADVFSWCALEGRVIARYQHLNLQPPSPENDFPHWSLGGQAVTQHSGRACHVETTYPQTASVIDYEGYTDPVNFNYDVDGVAWGARHWEGIGRIEGTVTAPDGTIVPVSGAGWQDRSWGPRRWATSLSHRLVWAAFGKDFFLSAIQLINETSPDLIPVGWVYDHGQLHVVERVTYGMEIDDDGHSPRAADARMWVEAGHGYHVTATAHVSSASSHLENFWFTQGVSTVECGGRLGSGFIEAHDHGGVPPWLRAQLGLDLPEALPAHA